MMAHKRETMQAAYDKAVSKHNHKKVKKMKHVQVFFPKGNKVQSILKKHRTTKQILGLKYINMTTKSLSLLPTSLNKNGSLNIPGQRKSLMTEEANSLEPTSRP